MKTIKVATGQTLFDIALQEYGCFEAVKRICELNNTSIDSELMIGFELLVDSDVPVLTDTNVFTYNYLKQSAIIPNSGFKASVSGVFYNHEFYNSNFYE
jgi:hypothetical protein